MRTASKTGIGGELSSTPIGQLFASLDDGVLAGSMERRVLADGDVLYRQGVDAELLCVVLCGRLSVSVTADDGTVQRAGNVGPGELLGAAALLRRQPNAETVVAVGGAEVVVLPAGEWQRLRSRCTGVEALLAREVEWQERTAETRRYRPDARWTCEWLGRTEVLAGLGHSAIEELERSLIWEVVPGGETLVSEGEPGACMWFVVRGRLRASVRGAGGVARTVGQIVSGECVGEMALLSSAPRSTTVRAVRDSELLRLPKPAFDRVVALHPELVAGFARTVVARLQRVLGARPPLPPERVLALLAGGAGVDLAGFAETLGAELSSLARTAVLDGTAAVRDRAVAAHANPEVVLLVCDPTLTPWTARCLREADDVVVVARAEGDPSPSPMERNAVEAAARRGADRHLVLLHADGATPTGTEAWLRPRPGTRHYHVRPGQAGHHARLARLLSGRATGLALSGGGARGFAHIGVLRALDELGVPVDMVAGTSMGAMIAATHALGYSPRDVLVRCREWTRRRPWSDFTLPLASIVRGRRIRRATDELLGRARIEDLWLPYTCITSNLSRAAADVHSAGPLSLLVLASNSVPGLAPPVYYQGDVHVDGGVMDNLPVEALRRAGAGRVIAVDVGTEMRVAIPPRACECPSGWTLLWDGFWRRPRRALPVAATIGRAFTLASDERTHAACRDADASLRPPLDGYTSSDFGLIDEIAEIGYRYAREHLADWPAR